MTDLHPFDPTTSPFDVIRQEDARGEFWSARDLMPLLGYQQWRQFADAIARASAAAVNTGHDPDGHFAVTRKNPSELGGRPAEDFRLTRFGAYLVAMNGDPRKAQVADAQAYFVVKTREAEVATKVPTTMREALVLALEAEDRRLAAEAIVAQQAERLAIAAPKEDFYDAFSEDADDLLVRNLAKLVDLRESQLRAWMVGKRMIYRHTLRCGTSVWEAGSEARAKQHVSVRYDPAPHNRVHLRKCMHPTVYVTPKGAEYIFRRLRAEGVIHE